MFFYIVNQCFSIPNRLPFQSEDDEFLITVYEFPYIYRYSRLIILKFFFKFVAPTFTKRLMIRNVVVCISRPRGRICAFCGVICSIFVTECNKRHCTRDILQGRQKSLWLRYEPGPVVLSALQRVIVHNTYIIINSL